MLLAPLGWRADDVEAESSYADLAREITGLRCWG